MSPEYWLGVSRGMRDMKNHIIKTLGESDVHINHLDLINSIDDDYLSYKLMETVEAPSMPVFVDGSWILGWDSKFPFGKYKGFPVEAVFFENPSYLDWFSKEVRNYKFNQEIIDTIAAMDKKSQFDDEDRGPGINFLDDDIPF
jgi:hypothetical protein